MTDNVVDLDERRRERQIRRYRRLFSEYLEQGDVDEAVRVAELHNELLRSEEKLFYDA